LAEEGSPLAAAQQLSRGIRRQRFAVSLCRRVVDVGWLSGVRWCGCVGRGVWRAPAPVIDEKSTMTNRSTTAPAIMPDCCSSRLAPLMSANFKVRRGGLGPREWLQLLLVHLATKPLAHRVRGIGVAELAKNCGETVRPSVFTLPLVWASRVASSLFVVSFCLCSIPLPCIQGDICGT
jgi:hypothetical protein